MDFEPIHQLVRHTGEVDPERVAIECGPFRSTYGQLHTRVGKITARLLEAGVEPGSLVAVLTDRSADVIAAILGILHARCAFVPLDPHFPPPALPELGRQVPVACWLAAEGRVATAEQLRDSLGLNGEVLSLSADWPEPGAPAAPLPARVAADPDSLCYVYFTSGSTGIPKGIGGRLKAIDHFIRWEIEAFGITAETRVSQLISPAFDAFLRDAFVPLAAGGTVCVPPDREVVLDTARLVEWIDREEIHLVHCTPSLFRMMLAQGLTPDHFPALRHVLLSGEVLQPADVERWYSLFGSGRRLVNLYGPSETTMVKFFHPVTPEDAAAAVVPIGKPMPGAKAILLDDHGAPCAPGKLGEIIIRTPYRSLGYLNRPELTAEVFVHNPFSDDPQDLVYKTGDFGRLRQDGSFEFVGRRDHQVKVRGVRVELAAIENSLHQTPGVTEAVVVPRTDSQDNTYLCAYLVLAQEVTPHEVAAALRERMPEWMIPSRFVALDRLPRTATGKIDRRSLPQVEEGSATSYVAPRTPTEESLCRIFSELLRIPKVGIHDSFFELGGHSLLATLLLFRIRAELGVEVPLRQVFEGPTVEGLAVTVTELQLELEGEAELESLLGEIEGLSAEEIGQKLTGEAAG